MWRVGLRRAGGRAAALAAASVKAAMDRRGGGGGGGTALGLRVRVATMGVWGLGSGRMPNAQARRKVGRHARRERLVGLARGCASCRDGRWGCVSKWKGGVVVGKGNAARGMRGGGWLGDWAGVDACLRRCEGEGREGGRDV